jgi:four helix bundle protein
MNQLSICDCRVETVNPEDFKKRTKGYALRILQVVESLPKSVVAKTIGGQLARCGTSVGSNYRAACRARSRADFVAKMGIVEEECDESLYWMEMLAENKKASPEHFRNLILEANELLSIVIASIKTARSNR